MAAPRNPKLTYPWQWLFWPLTWIFAKILRQDPNLVVLTSFHGDGYRGNTRKLFEWLHSEEGRARLTGKRVVWLSRNRHLVRELRDRFGYGAAEYAHSFSGARILARSRVALLTHGTSDYPFMFIPPRTHVIQTYHGHPTKCGEFLRLEGQEPPGTIETYFLNRRFQPIDTFLSTSDFVTDLFSKRFGLPQERFLKIGFPVNDELLTLESDPAWVSKLYPDANAATKLIVYAPTFRYTSPTQLFPFMDMDRGDLGRFLEQHNLVLAIRTHPNDEIDHPDWLGAIQRVVIASDKVFENVNDLIVNASVIITDYSSIYLEGLLRDIPPVFIPYDLDEYERGFPFEYESVTPGPCVLTYSELKESLIDALGGAMQWKFRREEVRKQFFESKEADSTLMLWDYIIRL